MTTYADLGVRPIINVAATLTRLGGSCMPPPVIEAMVSASHAFVDLDALQQRVGARIAELTHNPACYVSSGAAAGLAIALLATRTIQESLFGVSPADPMTLVAVTILLLAVGLCACLVPGLRAASIDPMEVMKAE